MKASRGLSSVFKEINMKNVFYFKNINSIGGVESFLYYLSKKYDFEVVYRTGSPEQIERLAKLVKVRKYKEPIKCDRFFGNYGLDIEIEASEKYHIVHCDYKNVWFSPIQYDGFKYIGVSQLACDSFKELTGKDIELSYNPIYLDNVENNHKRDKKLRLISATRLTREKGLKRMQRLAWILDTSGIDYEWVVFTNRFRGGLGQHVIYKEPKLDIIEDIKQADFLVQLSDCEAFCYSVVEALMCGTPVIATDLPVFKELGLNESNSILCDLDMKNFNLESTKKEFNFKYQPPKDNWGKWLSTKKEYDPSEKVKVKVLKRYTDIFLGHLDRNAEIEMAQERASYLEAKELVEIL